MFEETPRFVWRDEAKFNNLGAANEDEAAALTSFGVAIPYQRNLNKLISALRKALPMAPTWSSRLRTTECGVC
jgi:hypothetical protein